MLADKDSYITGRDRVLSLPARIFLRPVVTFYPQFFFIIWLNGRRALKGRYGGDKWASSSLDVMHALENVGVGVEISGMDNLRKREGPVVYIANHMSTLETMVLPCILQPVKETTFIVKQSLINMPVFGPVMRSRDPIVVNRTNPREDLKAVLDQGTAKLAAGISIVVFPQSTRATVFDPSEFNSLGIKLALKAGAPVLPVALKTDAWGIGKRVKEFGRIDNKKTVHFAFGEPMDITGRGAGEHEKVIAFIQGKLQEWARQ